MQPLKFLDLLKEQFYLASFIPNSFYKHYYSSIPDESVFSRFKINFEKDIHSLFDNMIPSILDICSSFDDMLTEGDPLKGLSSTLIYDTSGLKPMVKENNPKTLTSEIKRFKAYAKTINNKDFNPYGAAYKNMDTDIEGTPLCPLTKEPFKPDGSCKGKNPAVM